MWNKRKSAKDSKNKLQLLKRFLSGEDVVKDILNDGVPKITGFVFVCTDNDLKDLTPEQQNELKLIDDDITRYKRYREMTLDAKKPAWFPEGETTKEGKPSWYDQIDTVVWMEKKQRYPDPDIEGVSYSRPENVPVRDFKPTPAIVPEKRESIERSKRKETKPIIEPQDKEINTYSAHTQRGNRYVFINGKQVDLDDMGFMDVPFHGWLNGLGRR